ncbi:unnamed protein product, partial [Oppiella nova]
FCEESRDSDKIEVELVRVGTIKVDVSHCSREFFRNRRVWLVAYKIPKDSSSREDDIKASIIRLFKAPTPDIVKKRMNTTTSTQKYPIWN